MARGSIVKRASGNYAVVYYVGGKQKWKTVGPNKKAAEKELTAIMAKVDCGEYRDIKEITFPEFADKWLEEYVEMKCKSATYRDYRTCLKRHLAPYFGNVPLASISPDTVQGYVSAKLKEGKISAKTINNTLVPLKEMLKHAVIWGYLRSSPAVYVEKPRVEKREMDFLIPAEVRLFLGHATPKFYPLALFAVTTGMRIGEILGTKWSDISWATNQIHVHRSLDEQSKLVEPKSKTSVRRINMSPTLIGALKRYQLQSTPNEYDLVFCNTVGKPLNRINVVMREFKPTLRRAGLREIRFHDLRHTFASLLIHQGENIKYIQSQMGHASAQITWDRYGHLMPEVDHGAGKRLDETLFGSKSISRTLAEPTKIEEQSADYSSNALLKAVAVAGFEPATTRV